jgi:aspirochlorine biosynthesis cytochrome P450 monooxygenase
MGRSERFFDNPKEFRPERWLTTDDSNAHHVEGTDGCYADEVLRPFSLGPRNCVGKLSVHLFFATTHRYRSLRRYCD